MLGISVATRSMFLTNPGTQWRPDP